MDQIHREISRNPEPSWGTRVDRPTLLLNGQRAQRNIGAMVQLAEQHLVRLRPHYKTHQSATVAEWFRAVGVTAASVSSLEMAAYFASHGWADLVVAFPVNLRQLDLLEELACVVRLGIFVDSPESAAAVADRVRCSLDIWIELDTGYGRSGVAWSDTARLTAIAHRLTRNPALHLAGLAGYAGQSYRARGAAEVRAIHDETVERLKKARAALGGGYGSLQLSVGGTPICSLADNFAGLDEIRPGNFVFYDLTQLTIGSCAEEQIALAMACPIVASYPDQGRLVLYGGAAHLSKDSVTLADGRLSFGAVARPTEDGWGALLPELYVASLSQEHGVILGPSELIASFAPGDLLIVVPAHACMAALTMGRYLTLSGEWITALPSARNQKGAQDA